ncbi:helix-turn-helix domain-containing protein [Kushneria phosphatilytica]|uniref:Helix-turn-helix transcriptional regulator n=1 Tax=Kushneria phosphatilytica TaxID=657387 RepID=A0A1S1NRP8_9GAMM|nr:XRE family transcriptional regulator [Kushneria phosphatilytica]OHV11909.1 transcriptional regulator [Kushneria phosphatilytica]QEL11086.1 helix-turn-helix transcriptional regulator [Kushneria phosphatilytica]
MSDTNESTSSSDLMAHPKDLVEPLQLGERLRAFRLARRWTLEDVRQRTGVARSTLSKIENDQLSPTFTVVQKLVTGLGINLPQLLRQPLSPPRNAGRRELNRAGDGHRHPTPTYEHELLASRIQHKHMVPFKTVVRARDIKEFPDWVRHGGEEFLLVLEGAILLYCEGEEPLQLECGDSLYFDSSMGHAKVSISPEDAVVLSVCTDAD